MAVKAISFKNWCTENISPQSWVRIVLRSIDVVREEGMTLKQLEKPDPELELSENLTKVLNQSLADIYEMRVEEGLLNV